AGRHEGGAVARLGELEAQYAAIEPQRAIEIGDLEMHMPDPHPRVDRLRGGRAGLLQLLGTAHGALLRSALIYDGEAEDAIMPHARNAGVPSPSRAAWCAEFSCRWRSASPGIHGGTTRAPAP